MKIVSARDWLEVPELPCPKIRSERENGKVYKVARVAVVAFPLSACDGIDLTDVWSEVGKFFFTKIEFTEAGKQHTRRLPLGLTNWAIDTVSLAQAGLLTFPMKIEFGVLDGRAYAEML